MSAIEYEHAVCDDCRHRATVERSFLIEVIIREPIDETLLVEELAWSIADILPKDWWHPTNDSWGIVEVMGVGMTPSPRRAYPLTMVLGANMPAPTDTEPYHKTKTAE